jgi:protein TonB
MKNASFWIALALSGSVHTLAYGLVVLLWLFSGAASSPPIALVAYGNSSLEGFFTVDAVALDPGTLQRGDANTPGGDEMPPPKASEPTPTETPASELEPQAVALPKVPEAEPAVPAPVEKVAEPPMAMANTEPRPMKTASEAATATKAAGAPGGSRLPQGTPSRGGTVGSSNGVRMIGLPRPAYPRDAVAGGIEGEVMLFLRISAEGKVTEVRVHKSSGHRVLDEAALSFGKTLKFVAARENYQAVETTALFPVTYELTARR